jgi:hypothetical protein
MEQGVPVGRRAGDRLRQVNADEQWLRDHGFRVEVEQEEPDLFWAHLVHRVNPEGRVTNYGRGATADQSIESARRRY